MKSFIKKLLREGLLNEINQNNLTIDYFKKRLPFLRNTRHEVQHSRGVQIHSKAQHHPDAKMVLKDGITTFEYFVTGIIFEYTIGKVSGSDDVLHHFKLTPQVQFEMNDAGDVTKTVALYMFDAQLKGIGVNDSFQVPKGTEELPDEELDRIVNNMNKTLFDFEDFLSKFGVEINL